MCNKGRLLALILTLALAGCGGGGGGGGGGDPSPGSVKIDCVDFRNTGEAPDCRDIGAALAHATTTQVDLGTISRSQEVFISMEVTNSTASQFAGYWEATITLDCGGRPVPWVMASGDTTITAGQTITYTVSRTCGDATLGVHTATLTLYESDRTTVVDEVEGTFTLVN